MVSKNESVSIPNAPDNPVALMLSRLKGVKRAGNEWTALCPAHEDTQASLSIGSGSDGRALVFCHAGCSASSVCESAGLKESDLFANSTWAATATNGKRGH
jgi:hypothetical protein